MNQSKTCLTSQFSSGSTLDVGPLTGTTVVELSGLGPGPFAAMMLSDLGADVIRIERPGPRDLLSSPRHGDPLLRGRRSIVLDLKHASAREVAARGIARADVLIDPFRPGTVDRLGIGPADCIERNPRLVYAHATGWGQTGPLAQAAGHDLNYLALTGALAAIGTPDQPPPPPLNLIADFGGGGMLLTVGILAALLERERSGRGQIVDAAMVDGVASLLASVIGMRNAGIWSEQRGSNILDGSAPFYACYETADGRFMSVAAIEPKFYATLLGLLGLDPEEWPQDDRSRWPALRATLARTFCERPQREWCELLDDPNACVAPVLNLTEAAQHPHLRHRSTFLHLDGDLHPAPAPRLSRTPARIRSTTPTDGAHAVEILNELRYTEQEIDALLRSGAVDADHCRVRGL